MEPTHTALIIEIPAAEPAVNAHRTALDRAASWGVPAHITLVFPFLPPDKINDDTLTAIHQIAAAETPFDVTLDSIGWFGDTVVWLAPNPAQPFIALTAALAARFPQAQPYGGAFDETIPHLTIGHDHPRPTLEAAATAVTRHLPITTTVTSIRLIAGAREPGDNWHPVADFPLGP
ncbi:2'-5' RNA ligase family protein [Actinoplanes sp. NPDC048791]|uniref:2'-5' RNA ligase family protein n=1 Tax=Actinoplanes sp. NPDC048791 TaxID=3154623 RepID=UPI0033F2744D